MNGVDSRQVKETAGTAGTASFYGCPLYPDAYRLLNLSEMTMRDS